MKSNKILGSLVVAGLATTLFAQNLTISEAYKLSLENAHDIKSSKYNLEASKEKITQAKSGLYPQVNFSSNYTKRDSELNHLNFRTNYEEKETTTDYALSLRQTIYNKDLFSKIDIETVKYEIGKLNLELQKQELLANVLKIYFDILKSQNTILLHTSYVKHNKAKLDAVVKKYTMKLVNKMDLLQMQVEYNTSKVDLEKEKKILEVYKSQLKQLVGTSKFNLANINFDKIDPSTISLMKSSVLKNNNFISNINIKRSTLSYSLSKYEIANAKSGHHPKLTFDARYTKYETNDTSVDYENFKKLALQLELPLYQGGYTSSRITSSKLMNKASLEDLLKVRRDTKIQYKQLLASFDAAVTSLDIHRESLKLAQLYYDSIALGFDNGLKSLVDVYDAQTKVHNVKYKYNQNMYELFDSYIGILMVTNNLKELKLIDEIIN